MRQMRRLCCAVFGVMAAVAGVGANTSWACVPQPVIEISPMSSAPSGTKVTLDGLRFGSDPVEVRWGTFDGPLLGRGTGPNFSADVTIPPAPAGLYTIVAFSRAADGSVGVAAQAVPFQVTEPGGAAARSPASTSSPHHGHSMPVELIGALLVALVLGALIGGLVTRRGRKVPAAP